MKAVSDELERVLLNPSAPLFEIVRPEAMKELLHSDHSTPWYGQLMTTPQIIAYFFEIGAVN